MEFPPERAAQLVPVEFPPERAAPTLPPASDVRRVPPPTTPPLPAFYSSDSNWASPSDEDGYDWHPAQRRKRAEARASGKASVVSPQPTTPPSVHRLLAQLQDRNTGGRRDHAPSGVAPRRARLDIPREASAAELADPPYPMEASPLVEYTNDEVLDGGMVLDVSCAMEDFARELHGHLKEKWLAESLPVQGLEDVRPIQGYDLTLEPYDPEEQLKTTLRIPSHRVNHVFRKIPGLRGLADEAHRLLCSALGEGTDLELFDAHVLKQRSQGTAGGGSFGPHRDNHDDPTRSLLKYSLIVKLTDDPPGAQPSQMQVLEGREYPPLSYGPKRGSCVLFRSQDLHTSLTTHISLGEAMKIAFFFRQRMALEMRPVKHDYTTLIERDSVEGGWRLRHPLSHESSTCRTRTSAPEASTRAMKTLPQRDPTAPYPSKSRAPRVEMPAILPLRHVTLTPHAWRHGAGIMVVAPDGGHMAAFMRVHAPPIYEGVTRATFLENVRVFREEMLLAGGCASCGNQHPPPHPQSIFDPPSSPCFHRKVASRTRVPRRARRLLPARDLGRAHAAHAVHSPHSRLSPA